MMLTKQGRDAVCVCVREGGASPQVAAPLLLPGAATWTHKANAEAGHNLTVLVPTLVVLVLTLLGSCAGTGRAHFGDCSKLLIKLYMSEAGIEAVSTAGSSAGRAASLRCTCFPPAPALPHCLLTASPGHVSQPRACKLGPSPPVTANCCVLLSPPP